MTGVVDEKVCKECGGKCCKFMGCQFSPEDFDSISVSLLKKEIEKGHISIDKWEGFSSKAQMSEIFFLRARHIGSEGKDSLAPIVDFSWGGQCSLLKEDGCLLTFNKRPKGGRYLKPRSSVNDACIPLYTKEDAVADWAKFQDVLSELAEFYK